METKVFIRNAKWEPVQVSPCEGWVAVYDDEESPDGMIVDRVCCWAIIRIWGSRKIGQTWHYSEEPRLEVVGLSADPGSQELDWPNDTVNFRGYCLAGNEKSLLPKRDGD